MTIAEYFERPDAKRILLVDIQRNDDDQTCYRLSDGYYITEDDDDPSSVAYAPVLQELPEFRRVLAEPFDGEASTGFGTFKIADREVSFTSTSTLGDGVADIELKRGAAITVRMAAPRRLFPLSDAIPLATGKIRRIGESSDGSRTFEVIDRTQEIADKPITIDTAVGPQTWGRVAHMTPFPTDPGTLEYSVHTGEVEDIEAVFDQGVELVHGVEWTRNNATGKFTLAGSPEGRVITANVKGGKVGGVWLSSLEQIIEHLLDAAGVTIDTDISLPSGVASWVISESTKLGDVITSLVRGCAGYWLINRTGELVAGQYPVPVGGTVYDEKAILGEATSEAVDRLYDSIRYVYRKNWTKYQALPGATSAVAAFAASIGIEETLTDTPSETELDHETSPLVETCFYDQADAEAVAQRLWDIYSEQRKLITGTVPYSEALDIGSGVTVEYDGLTYDGAVVGVVDRFGAGYPEQQITVIA